ncbi:MAG: DciA family protein [Pseudomonadota bacterium]
MQRTGRGPRRISALVDRDIKKTGQRRGFSEARLLTRWTEIAGEDIAAQCRPVRVSFPRGSMGAVLTLLTTGAHASVLQMQLPQLRERVNACYGYNAITRIDITQTAPNGFAEGQVAFRAKAKAKPCPKPEAIAAAKRSAAEVGDADLRASLERLGANIISKARP